LYEELDRSAGQDVATLQILIPPWSRSLGVALSLHMVSVGRLRCGQISISTQMNDLRIIHGNSLEKLDEIESESVQVCVTSPPYFLARDYKVPPTIWGGDPECEHEWDSELVTRENRRGINLSQSDVSTRGGGKKIAAVPLQTVERAFCVKCKAWRGCLGHEPQPELYIKHLVMIFAKVKRTLRKDGTLWINIGDTYANDQSGPRTGGTLREWKSGGRREPDEIEDIERPDIDIDDGNLIGIPWMLAFAMQRAGWILRRDNIWAKQNGLPESVRGWRWEKHRIKVAGCPVKRRGMNGNQQAEITDPKNNAKWKECPGCDVCRPHNGFILRKGNWRCTSAHEYVFQFSKSDRYFCDSEAVREPLADYERERRLREMRQGLDTKFNISRDDQIGQLNQSEQGAIRSAAARQVLAIDGKRNKRSVWSMPVAQYMGPHFAVFPRELVKPIVLAASPVKSCAKCGAPYAPVIERGEPDLEHQRACGSNAQGEYFGEAIKDYGGAGAGVQNASAVKQRILAGMVERKIVDHWPSCKCGVTETTRPVCLDPFGGTGTLGEVAIELGRAAIVIEIGEQNIPLIRDRCDVTPGFQF
jgi:DNA modification methylase